MGSESLRMSSERFPCFLSRRSGRFFSYPIKAFIAYARPNRTSARPDGEELAFPENYGSFELDELSNQHRSLQVTAGDYFQIELALVAK